MNNYKNFFLNNWCNYKTKIKISSLFLYLFLFLITFVFVLPFYLMFITSIKSTSEIIENNPLSLPMNLMNVISNYKKSFSEQFSFIPYFWNTFKITFLSTFFGTLCCILTAYALSSIFDFTFKPALMILLYLGLMTTSETLTIVNYRTAADLGWIDFGRGSRFPFGNDFAIIIPYLINIVHVLLLLRIFENVPKELYYAAKIDGTSDWKYLWKILVPITKPTIIITVVFRIVSTWNAYAWPELMGAKLLTNMMRKTFDSETGIETINIQMAVAVLINIPLILIFIFFRKYITSGENTSGIKG
ncbi:MAG: carbohydrate ABC transporter permease [Phytoplasma sp.]|uniref:carbohydrate ABC transporter permease n=1 Tax=Phytoplasma sp. TaxID=2155 RepID=UPI002B406425|nr:carbohydrate ABC transporter permease [Phytoplasma sp.]WRH06862.1 MAG: carbohydrate ABC transporter permease [Phytoplasma sp.]